MNEQQDIAEQRSRMRAVRERRRSLLPIGEDAINSQTSETETATARPQRGKNNKNGGQAQARRIAGRWLKFALDQSRKLAGAQIPGTQLTEPGLEQAVERLNQTADGEGKGSKVSQRLRQYLTRNTTDENRIAGSINLEQLRSLVELNEQEKTD